MKRIIYNIDSLEYGYPTSVTECIKRKVNALCRQDRNVEKFYIGIAGGEDYKSAMMNSTCDNIREMHVLYTTTILDHANDIMRDLEKFFTQNKRMINRCITPADIKQFQNYYVYVAIQPWT